MDFPFDFTDKSKFKQNQTICMQMFNRNKDYGSRKWTADNCFTEYQIEKGKINCKCYGVNQSYYGIMLDLSRMVAKNETVKPPPISEKVKKVFNSVALVVIIFLIVMLFVMPIIAVLREKSDYRDLKEDVY